MKNKLLSIYQNAQFYPNILGVFVNPFFIARKGLHTAIVENLHQLSGKLLDVGCGSKPYKVISSATTYIGLEIDSEENRKTKNADFYYDGKNMPFSAEEFDSVLCNQVLEHVFNPSEFLDEINRVLKISGQGLFTVPFTWDEHEQPYDYARYTSFGLKHLFEQHGFEVIKQEKINNGFQVLLQLLNCYIYKVSHTNSFILNVAICVLIISPFNLIGIICSKLLPKNNDLFLDNLIIVRKIANA